MALCPACQQSIEILDSHLGTLFTCPHCNAVYFVDWNGQPEMAQHEPEPLATEEPPPPFQENPVEPTWDSSEAVPPSPLEENPSFAEEEPVPEFTPLSNDLSEQPEAFVPPIAETSDAPYDFNQVLGEVPAPEASSADSADLSDIANFGNADSVTGALSYTLVIEGLDSAALRKQLFEVLSDPRFAWNAEEMMESIQNGSLEISELNPVKAAVLINQIKYLALRYSWRQNVF